jgi:PhnB protein
MANKKPQKKPIKKAKSSPAKSAPKKSTAKPAVRPTPKPAPKSGAKAKSQKVLQPAPRKQLATPPQPKWLPAGYRSLTTRLVVRDSNAAIEWYKRALGAEEVVRHVHNGMCMHAELKIGDSRLHLNDAVPNSPSTAPNDNHMTTCGIDVYVPDCDSSFARAIENGAVVVMPLMDAFWGDRCGVLKDPFGHVWMVATRKQTLSKEQIDAAAQQEFSGAPSGT